MALIFSCAVGSIEMDGHVLRFDTETTESHLCRLFMDEAFVATFNTNGALISVEEVPLESLPGTKAADAKGDAAPAPQTVAQADAPPKGSTKK